MLGEGAARIALGLVDGRENVDGERVASRVAVLAVPAVAPILALAAVFTVLAGYAAQRFEPSQLIADKSRGLREFIGAFAVRAVAPRTAVFAGSAIGARCARMALFSTLARRA